MADRDKIMFKCNGNNIVTVSEDEEGILDVTLKHGEHLKIRKDEVLLDACSECSHPSPVMADILVDVEPRAAGDSSFRQVKEFESKSIGERWEYFRQEMSRCIRCYACRQACPNCYCKVCFADQTNPGWLHQGDDLSDIMIYHIGRIFHQAGRCVGCDACVRACPVHIDLRLFTRKMVMDVKELFGFVPGLSVDSVPPLCTFSSADNEDFITDPDK
jgi:ferredoxin